MDGQRKKKMTPPSLRTCRNVHFRNRKTVTPFAWVQQRLTKTAKDSTQTIYCSITVDDSGIIRFRLVYRFNDRLSCTRVTWKSKWNIGFYWKCNRLNNVRGFTSPFDRLNMSVCSITINRLQSVFIDKSDSKLMSCKHSVVILTFTIKYLQRRQHFKASISFTHWTTPHWNSVSLSCLLRIYDKHICRPSKFNYITLIVGFTFGYAARTANNQIFDC